VHQHGRASIAESAERAASHYLETVEQLEDGGDPEQECAHGDHRGIAHIEPHDPLRHDGQQHSGCSHE